MRLARGTITVLQEERFQLDCDDGVKRLFLLSHKAPLESDELAELQRQRAQVQVEYEESPGLLAHTALRLQEMPNEKTPRH